MPIMALNKQTKTIIVATIGTVPIKATIVAKFQHTPAFVFFVIANGNASLHNLLMLGFSFVGHKFTSLKGLAPLAIPILDLINVAIVSGGASAAAFMGQLGRDGNSHTRLRPGWWGHDRVILWIDDDDHCLLNLNLQASQ
ncbi:CASP-like protein 1b1 [Phtheirospermum japonicum]|uniref:CASP-like protein n=1 Tax=Phtheirospermum japonicum TaxID=374723 RepID=A0A830D4P4_9LAMI|nr:CASP-like protein 1b1 [Phtheirospermum japonicum]